MVYLKAIYLPRKGSIRSIYVDTTDIINSAKKFLGVSTINYVSNNKIYFKGVKISIYAVVYDNYLRSSETNTNILRFLKER